MPHVSLQLYAGRTEAEKALIAEALVSAIMDSTGASRDAVSVSIEDVAPTDWAHVYHAITAAPDRLYKAPGYTL